MKEFKVLQETYLGKKKIWVLQKKITVTHKMTPSKTEEKL